MIPDPADNWQRMYETRSATDLSWYQPVPERSLELIQATAVPREAPILDVRGGASRLVDHLLAAGYTDVSVLDLAPAALAQARARLGPLAERVTWIVADITTFTAGRRYTLWHDRAVLHFLLRTAEQGRYLTALRRGLTQRGTWCWPPLAPEVRSGAAGSRSSATRWKPSRRCWGPGSTCGAARSNSTARRPAKPRSSCTLGGRLQANQRMPLSGAGRPGLDPAHQRAYSQRECAGLLEAAGYITGRLERYKIGLWGLMTVTAHRGP
jgi:hypothetical protein